MSSQQHPPAPPTAPPPVWRPPVREQPAWVPPVPVYPYAHWGRRVGAFLIDVAPVYLAMVPFWVGYALFYRRVVELPGRSSRPLRDALLDEPLRPALVWMVVGVVVLAAALGWLGWNRWRIAGRTGQSVGRRLLRTALVAEVNGRPIGPVNAFLRDLLHALDAVAYVGFLWPLWHPKRQTFADLLMATVVVDRRAPAEPAPPWDPTGDYPYGAGS
jgi:uncharacterized RDD family membrane protein YckC